MAKPKKTKNNVKSERKPNASEVVCKGTVLEAFPNAMFTVQLDNGFEILCTVCGKMQKNHIRILPGDHVDVGVSIYDNSRGRILFRYK